MIKIIEERGAGKAKKLLAAAREIPNSFIITKDKRGLGVKAHAYGYDDIEICDYEDLENDNYPIDGNALILNGDRFLEFLLEKFYNINMVGFSATLDKGSD